MKQKYSTVHGNNTQLWRTSWYYFFPFIFRVQFTILFMISESFVLPVHAFYSFCICSFLYLRKFKFEQMQNLIKDGRISPGERGFHPGGEDEGKTNLKYAWWRKLCKFNKEWNKFIMRLVVQTSYFWKSSNFFRIRMVA